MAKIDYFKWAIYGLVLGSIYTIGQSILLKTEFSSKSIFIALIAFIVGMVLAGKLYSLTPNLFRNYKFIRVSIIFLYTYTIGFIILGLTSNIDVNLSKLLIGIVTLDPLLSPFIIEAISTILILTIIAYILDRYNIMRLPG